jgi:ADP-ribosylation factor-binding protein GGA
LLHNTGSVPPLTVLDEKSGITVILNFGKDSPRPDVSVIVVTTISKNSSPISNYLFQAVVPKVWHYMLQITLHWIEKVFHR